MFGHLATVPNEEYAMALPHVQRLESSFKLGGTHGDHEAFVMPPMEMSLDALLAGQREGR